MNTPLAGSLAGFVATGPMSAAMLLMHRRLPRREQYALPPHQITGEIAERAGAEEHVNTPEHEVASLVAHFGYGAATGAVYAPLSEKVPAHPVVKGVAFGLFVWGISYLGWLPAAKIINTPAEQSARRNLLMIAAHVVWGATLGVLTERWRED